MKKGSKGLDYKRAHIILNSIGIILVFLSVIIGSLVLSEMMKSTVPAEESSVNTTTASQEAVVSTAIYHHSGDIEAEIELLQYKPNEESTIEYGEESSSLPEESSDVSEDERDTYEEESDTSSEESSEYCEDVYSEETSYIAPEVKEEQPVQNKEEVVEEQIEESEPNTESSPSEEQNVSYTDVSYTDEDLYYLTCAIVGEGQNVSFEEQIAVASVVVNRLNSEWFDYTSIKEVCTAPGQYTSFSNGMAYREPTEENIAAAKYVLENGSQLPGNCIFQSLHQQGNGVYKYFADTGTYICYK